RAEAIPRSDARALPPKRDAANRSPQARSRAQPDSLVRSIDQAARYPRDHSQATAALRSRPAPRSPAKHGWKPFPDRSPPQASLQEALHSPDPLNTPLTTEKRRLSPNPQKSLLKPVAQQLSVVRWVARRRLRRR